MKKLALTLIFLKYVIIIHAMEEQPEIEPTSPRIWVQSLQNLHQSKKKYSNFFNDIIRLIEKQLPIDQLQLYSSMIETALELNDSNLVSSLCERFSLVYSTHFYGTGSEDETFKYVIQLKKILQSRKLNNNVLKLLHFSSTGALPPLQEDESTQVVKKSMFLDGDAFELESVSENDENEPSANGQEGCFFFGTNYQAAAFLFFVNKIITATVDGSIVVFNTTTGKLFYKSKKRTKNKSPLFIVNNEIKSKNKALKVKYLQSGHSVIYAKKDVGSLCIMPTNDMFVVGNGKGKLSCERLSKKTIVHYERQSGAITALFSLSNSRFLSGSFDGVIKVWDLKKDTCIKRITSGCSIIDFTLFDGDVLYSDANNRICRLDLQRKHSFILYKSDETVKKILGFKEILIAGLLDGGLRLWHKQEGFGKSVHISLNPQIQLCNLTRNQNNLYCFYKDGMIIKLPYGSLEKFFGQAVLHNFDSFQNKSPKIVLQGSLSA